MNDKQTTRRRFLVAALTFSGVASSSLGISFLRSSAAWAAEDMSSDTLDAMGRFAQLLFPHEGLAHSVYGDIITDILDAAATGPATAGLISVAEEALNNAQEENWIDISESRQLTALLSLQEKPFFAGMRETVRFRLYHHPLMWEHIKYPGSSKEHGGYLYRGFDDIDWLPEEA